MPPVMLKDVSKLYRRLMWPDSALRPAANCLLLRSAVGWSCSRLASKSTMICACVRSSWAMAAVPKALWAPFISLTRHTGSCM
jgi:hypothetical protein